MKKIKETAKLPPGYVVIPTAYLGRYREFDNCLNQVGLPVGSVKKMGLGCDIGYSFNEVCRVGFNDPKIKWFWILGDDHVFAPDLWRKLYDRNVDIVVPLCLRRGDWEPTLNYGEEGGFTGLPDRWAPLVGKSGLMEWSGTVGNAGMLIRRNVLEEIEFPWFRQGQLDPKFSSSDLYFCHAAQKAGFKVYVDLDNHIGHIDHIALWPRKGEDGHWYLDFRPAAL